jgi:hypothetical protein
MQPSPIADQLLLEGWSGNPDFVGTASPWRSPDQTVPSFIFLPRWRGGAAARAGLDPHSAAVMFVALMDGLRVQWLTDRDAVELAGPLRASVRLALDPVPELTPAQAGLAG